MGGTVALTPDASSAQIVIIYHDGGGVLQERLQAFDEFQRKGTQVEIRGKCKSACTVYLGLDNVCVTPDALVSFHGPLYADGTKMSGERFDHWTRVLASYYPKGIDRWFMTTARHVRGGRNFLTVRGAELIKFGVRKCDRNLPT